MGNGSSAASGSEQKPWTDEEFRTVNNLLQYLCHENLDSNPERLAQSRQARIELLQYLLRTRWDSILGNAKKTRPGTLYVPLLAIRDGAIDPLRRQQAADAVSRAIWPKGFYSANWKVNKALTRYVAAWGKERTRADLARRAIALAAGEATVTQTARLGNKWVTRPDTRRQALFAPLDALPIPTLGSWFVLRCRKNLERLVCQEVYGMEVDRVRAAHPLQLRKLFYFGDMELAAQNPELLNILQNIAKYDCWSPREFHLRNDDWLQEIDFTSDLRRARTAISGDGDPASGAWKYARRPEIDRRAGWLIEQQKTRRPDIMAECERAYPIAIPRFMTGLDHLLSRVKSGADDDGDNPGAGVIDPEIGAAIVGWLDAYQPGLGPQEREVFNRYMVLRKSSGMSPHEIRREIRRKMEISPEHLRQIRRRITIKRGPGWEK